MDTKERMMQLLDYLNLGSVQLAKACGLKQTRLYEIEAGRTKRFSPEVADAIVSKFTNVSRDWLLYGTGDMVVEQKPEPATPSFTGGKHGGLSAADIEGLAPIIELITKQQAAIYEKQMAAMTDRYEAMLKRYEDKLEAITAQQAKTANILLQAQMVGNSYHTDGVAESHKVAEDVEPKDNIQA